MGSYEVVQKPAIQVIGIDCRTSNAPEAGPQDIPKLWGRFYSEDVISQIPHKVSNEVIALYCDYEGDYTQPYSVVIGCPVSSVDSIPDGMVAKNIPASSYAIFRARGDYPASLIETWGNIWQEHALERTYTGDYEVYDEKFFSKSPQEVEVCVAVRSPLTCAQANASKFSAIRALNLPLDQYAITGSGPLGIRNLRVISDIDVIVTPELWDHLADAYGITDDNHIKKIVFPDGIVEALGEQDKDTTSIIERIASAEVIDGLPFESLEHLLYFKRQMNREKDKKDIEMIESLINEQEKNI